MARGPQPCAAWRARRRSVHPCRRGAERRRPLPVVLCLKETFIDALFHVDHRDLLDPKTLLGAAVWAAIFLAGAATLGAAIRAGARRLEPRLSDITGLRFSSAFLQALTYLLAFILYAHLVPGLRALGTAVLAGVSVVSIILGLAAEYARQSCRGNVAGALPPIRVGDSVQLASPRGLITATVRRFLSATRAPWAGRPSPDPGLSLLLRLV